MPGWAPWLLAGGVVLAAVAGWVLRRRAAEGDPRPRGGDIWWARVPYADGTGAKLRPCLVLRRRRQGVLVLKITSQDKSHRRDHILIPTRSWDPRARRDSYLNLGEPVLVRHDAFQRRAGRADRATLRRVALGRAARRGTRSGPAR
ncbi:type II toxin-antitoxin system PemK/MazF family toxin [Jidongwangia harbinensis]|uniref:type II toxin-antitoxin system PemK/MazF family toxin n=1 Tax=Jidongwangia harbinensis TaxID=2878561 RepID=UPI001CDA3AB3|nr:type II toxin-antitoxin system PemK/MazF family toxin [Jidongwangia harbinensis]MCA2217288.1 type II toxin-antitoxin system PemK/MazF family toxin [Jidongwangia harbinensis]